MRSTSTTTYILWLVYICLLLVLLPHTAWAFESMEPPGAVGGKFTAWTAAIAFEAAIAVLTHKLAKHIETTGRMRGWKRITARYFNPFALGLGVATLVSALANLAHAVEFGKPLAIFAQWGIPQGVYSLAFGGVLPVVSLIFARVLSNVTETEGEANPELEAAKGTIADLRRQVREAEQRAKAAEAGTEEQRRSSEELIRLAEGRARLAEERFGAMGDLFRRMFSEDKRERILAVKQWRPQLTGAAIAIIAESTPSYVSEVINTDAILVEPEQKVSQ